MDREEYKEVRPFIRLAIALLVYVCERKFTEDCCTTADAFLKDADNTYLTRV